MPMSSNRPIAAQSVQRMAPAPTPGMRAPIAVPQPRPQPAPIMRSGPATTPPSSPAPSLPPQGQFNFGDMVRQPINSQGPQFQNPSWQVASQLFDAGLDELYVDPQGGFFIRGPGRSYGPGGEPGMGVGFNPQSGRTIKNPYDTMMPSFYSDPGTGRLYNMQGQQIDPRDITTLPGGMLIPKSINARVATGGPTPGVYSPEQMAAATPVSGLTRGGMNNLAMARR